MVQTATRTGGVFGRFGKLGSVASIVLVLALGLGLIEAYKIVTAPWAVSWMPGPKLVGSWEGPLHARQGAEYRVFLDLEYVDEGDPSPRVTKNLGGTAHVCAQNGAVYDYTVWGGVPLFGSEAVINLTYGDPKLSGLGFSLRGPWSADALDVAASDNPFEPDGIYRHGSPRSTADPDDSFERATLRHATLADFERACKQLPPGR